MAEIQKRKASLENEAKSIQFQVAEVSQYLTWCSYGQVGMLQNSVLDSALFLSLKCDVADWGASSILRNKAETGCWYLATC